MDEKYLLYIDVLGFSELVKSDSKRVDEIYQIIDSLNVHMHPDFNTIVFSDTILVYNNANFKSCSDREYIVMYLCEFAQNLMYRLIGSGMFFRAILSFGDFQHYKLRNIEAFYGTVLINSYNDEKDINCCGLLIDKECQKYNKIFPTGSYNKDYDFVYLNQNLEDLLHNSFGFVSRDTISHYLCNISKYILNDFKYLQEIYYLMYKHPNPKIRSKHLETWRLYHLRYCSILDYLVETNFQI